MRATKVIVSLAVLMLILVTLNVSADTGCPAIDCSVDNNPRIIDISVSKVYGKTVEITGIIEVDTNSLPGNKIRDWTWNLGDGTVLKRRGILSKIGESKFKIVVSHTYSDYGMY